MFVASHECSSVSLNNPASRASRYGHRDATMILIGYRHGLRASELCDRAGRRPATRPQGQEWLAECPSDAG